ncbi:MAG: amidophosphoribosyltransferase, partial [SAR324 cluster bacterium]|nr:amidophosphoribosyltransferase [SAR324 cluster bacterium]
MCGIFGIFGHPKASELTFLGLHALQHRGQESAGISVSDGETIHTRRGQGLVSEVFSRDEYLEFEGNQAIGHVRYTTA